MRTLRNVLAVTAIMALGAGLALAGTVHPVERFVPEKDGTGGDGGARGLLDCSGAIDVDVSSGFVQISGTNVGAPNNVDYYLCSSWLESGGEVVYRAVFPDDVVWEVGIEPNGCDLDLAVLDQCDEDLGCLIVADFGVYVSEPFAGEFYFVVDGYNGAACDFVITFQTSPYVPPEPLDFCDLVLTEVYGTGTFSGDTCDGQNLITSYPDCNTWTENGLEDYYGVWMPAGSSFTVDLVHAVDSAIWVFDGCLEPFTCLAAADNEYSAGTETLTYSNPGTDTFVYLVIDSYSTGSCGEYTFEFTSFGGAVATQIETLSGVKSIFR